MTILLVPSQSLFRTVYVPPGGFDFPGSIVPLDQWPTAASEDGLDYWVDLGEWCLDAGGGLVADPLLTASVNVTPSGSSFDLAVGAVFITATNRVFIWLSSGRPGVTYEVQVNIVTAAGRSLTVLVLLFIDNTSPAEPPKPPPEGILALIAFDLTSTGSTIGDALQLSAITNVFTHVPPGTGAVVPPFLLAGLQFSIIHRDATGDQLLVYPINDGVTAFDGLAPGQPRPIEPPPPSAEMGARFCYETPTRLVGVV